MGMSIIIALVTFIVGGLLVWFVMRVLMKSRYDAVIREAEKESEVMKQKKLLEVKEKFLHLKADLEKQVSARNSKIQSVEAKLKQRELSSVRKTCNAKTAKWMPSRKTWLPNWNWLIKRNRILRNCTSVKSNIWKPFPDFLPKKQKNV